MSRKAGNTKVRSRWIKWAGGLVLVCSLIALLTLPIWPDPTASRLGKIINKHGFEEGVFSGTYTQLTIPYPNPYGIHYHSIRGATSEQEANVLADLRRLTVGWTQTNVDEFGAVFIKRGGSDNLFGVEVRRESMLAATGEGSMGRVPGPDLLLAVSRKESALESLWQRVVRSFGR